MHSQEKLESDFPERVLTTTLEHAVAAGDADADYAIAKIVVSAKSGGERGYRRPDGKTLVRVGIYPAVPHPAETYAQGVRVRICATRLAIQPQLAGIKSLNRLEQILARAEWSQPDILEGLNLDTGGRLICGTMSNVFVRLENQLVTPAITRCGVAGVMRRHVLTLLDQQDIAVDVRDINANELCGAREIFLTNSQFGALPVAQLDAVTLPVGPSTRKVLDLLAANGVGECAT